MGHLQDTHSIHQMKSASVCMWVNNKKVAYKITTNLFTIKHHQSQAGVVCLCFLAMCKQQTLKVSDFMISFCFIVDLSTKQCGSTATLPDKSGTITISNTAAATCDWKLGFNQQYRIKLESQVSLYTM